MQLSAAARLLDAEHVGGDGEFLGCSIDSRSLRRREMFMALRGERADAHDFVGEAGERGAAAALIDKRGRYPIPTLRVADVRGSMGRLGGLWRERFPLAVAAVTGSNGKTTVKEMLAAILAVDTGPVLATPGNLNNDIGLPLTLMRLGEEHRSAVLELGANHAGEIAYLAKLARPRVGVITQCAPAHLEGFGSIEEVARAKGELLEALDPRGVAVLNADDAFIALWRRLAGAREVLSFGLSHAADVSATWFSDEGSTRCVLLTPSGTAEVSMRLPGRHNVMNALAAAAAAIGLGVGLEDVAQGLAAVRPIHGRLERVDGCGGALIVDDTYNANPVSLAAGLAVLEGFAGARWLVLGDMAELGGDAARFHREAGALARAHGVQRLYATGEHCRGAVEEFGEDALHFESQEALIETLRSDLRGGVTVLVKGSRSARMERVVEALRLGG